MTVADRCCRLLVMASVLLCSSMLPCDGRSSGPVVDAYVGISPLSYFVTEIGGSRVHVEVLLPPAASPATYELSPQQFTRLSDADVLFTAGVPFEKRLLEKLSGSIKDLAFVYVGENIELRSMDPDHADDGHGHGLHDPHFWLDVVAMKTAVGTITDALVSIDPEGTAVYRARADSLRTELDSVDARIEEILRPHQGDVLLVFHPSYGYFADRYSLEQVAIEKHGKEPSARHLARITELAREHKITALFVQPQFSRKHAEVVANEIGAEVVTIDPLSADYARNLVEIAQSIASACGRDHGADVAQ